MADRKYDKYFVHYERSREEMETGFTANVLRIDDSICKGSNFYWVVMTPVKPMDPPFGRHDKYTWWVGHPPHIHKDAELIFLIGTDPQDPTSLGAEAEIYMGPELERHVITRSTIIFIPPNFIHCPYKVIRSWRPWIFMEINQGLHHTEKGYWQVLPEEVVAQMDKSLFKNDGYE